MYDVMDTLNVISKSNDDFLIQFQHIFPSVIKANILKRRSTGPTQFDDVVYTVQIVQDYKVVLLCFIHFSLLFQCFVERVCLRKHILSEIHPNKLAYHNSVLNDIF